MLTVRNLTAGYREKTVLHSLSFRLEKGLTVLLGQNGSGKTTLFRALSGSIPCEGEAILDGENLLTMSVKIRASKLSQVLGTHQTLAGLTGETLAEMAFYAANGIFYRPGKREKEKILQMARRLGIEPLLDRPLEKMSAGERQTAELLAAFCQDTPLMLLDEPTSALDYNRTHAFLSKLREISAQKILLATLHNPNLALAYADRILLLQDGGLAGDFVPTEVDASEAQTALRRLYPDLRVIQTENGKTIL